MKNRLYKNQEKNCIKIYYQARLEKKQPNNQYEFDYDTS